MSMGVSPRMIRRVLNLSFRVTGLREYNMEITTMITALNLLLRTIAAVNIALRAMEAGHPYLAALMVGVTLGGVAYTAYQSSKVSGGY